MTIIQLRYSISYPGKSPSSAATGLFITPILRVLVKHLGEILQIKITFDKFLNGFFLKDLWYKISSFH